MTIFIRMCGKKKLDWVKAKIKNINKTCGCFVVEK